MVSDHYAKLGFELASRAGDGSSSTWRLDLARPHPTNLTIKEITYA
jgi:hypothetical protein